MNVYNNCEPKYTDLESFKVTLSSLLNVEDSTSTFEWNEAMGAHVFSLPGGDYYQNSDLFYEDLHYFYSLFSATINSAVESANEEDIGSLYNRVLDLNSLVDGINGELKERPSNLLSLIIKSNVDLVVVQIRQAINVLRQKGGCLPPAPRRPVPSAPRHSIASPISEKNLAASVETKSTAPDVSVSMNAPLDATSNREIEAEKPSSQPIEIKQAELKKIMFVDFPIEVNFDLEEYQHPIFTGLDERSLLIQYKNPQKIGGLLIELYGEYVSSLESYEQSYQNYSDLFDTQQALVKKKQKESALEAKGDVKCAIAGPLAVPPPPPGGAPCGKSPPPPPPPPMQGKASSTAPRRIEKEEISEEAQAFIDLMEAKKVLEEKTLALSDHRKCLLSIIFFDKEMHGLSFSSAQIDVLYRNHLKNISKMPQKSLSTSYTAPKRKSPEEIVQELNKKVESQKKIITRLNRDVVSAEGNLLRTTKALNVLAGSSESLTEEGAFKAEAVVKKIDELKRNLYVATQESARQEKILEKLEGELQEKLSKR